MKQLIACAMILGAAVFGGVQWNHWNASQQKQDCNAAGGTWSSRSPDDSLQSNPRCTFAKP